MKVEIIIPGSCTPKARPRTTTILRTNAEGQLTRRTWGYTPKRSRDYATVARLVAQSACAEANFNPVPYPKPVRMEILFVLGRRATGTPDISNLIMQIFDVLADGICYDNDSQVVEVRARKKKGKWPLTHIIVEGVQEAPTPTE